MRTFKRAPDNSVDERVQVFVRLDNGNGCSLVARRGQAVSELVQELNRQDIELPPAYRILFRGTHINDLSRSLLQLGIASNSILHVEEAEDRGGRPLRMDVCVFWQGEKYIAKAERSEKVLKLKQTIYRLLRVLPRDQLLVFKGSILLNDHTLEHYRIRPDSLLCLHSTAKAGDSSDLHSDYEQGEGFTLKENELLESVLSLGGKKVSGASRSTLFRSDSMGLKNVEQPPPYEIEIHHRDDESEEEKEFNFDLFKSFGMNNPMTLSIGYNLFDSLKHPVHRFHLTALDAQHEQDEELEDDQNLHCQRNSLADSVTSFDGFP